MSRHHSSPVDTSVEEMLQATVSKQGRRISEQVSEIAQLKQSNAYLETQLATLFGEVKHWKSEQQKYKDEAHRHAGALSKANRDFKALEGEVKTAHEAADARVRAMRDKVQREVKKQQEYGQEMEVYVHNLRKEMHDKEVEIDGLIEKYTEVKMQLEKEQDEIEKARITTIRSPRASSSRRPTSHHPPQRHSSQVRRSEHSRPSKAAADRIAQLEEEVRCLKAQHHEGGCQEYQDKLYEQLGDSLEMQKAAEAEAEGLRHLAKMNDMLKKRREIDAERIVLLLSGKGDAVARAFQMQQPQLQLSAITTVATLPVPARQPLLQTSCVQSVSTQPVVVQKPSLGFSDVQTLVTLPVAPRKVALRSSGTQTVARKVVLQSAGTQTVARKAVLQSSGMQTVARKVVLQSAGTQTVAHKVALQSSGTQTVARKVVLQSSGMQTVAPKLALQSSGTQTLTTEPVVTQKVALQSSGTQTLAAEPLLPRSDALPMVAHDDVLCLSDFQAVSTTPRVSTHPPDTDKPSPTPSMITTIHDSGNDISSATPPPADNSIQEPDPLPTVALSINIKPAEKRNWTLLQYVQQAVSTTSSLDINGPLNLVTQFVNEMEKTEKDHVEQASLAKQWEKVAAEHRGELEALKESVKQGKCGVPEHRDLALKLRAREHELEAKESQFQMHLLTQKLLAREDEAQSHMSQFYNQPGGVGP